MLATGENAIIFDRIGRVLEVVSHLWGDATVGGVNILGATSIPFYLFANLLASLRIPGVIIQALTFWLLLVIGSVSVYYLVYDFVKDDRRSLAAVIAGLFYMLNPYAMIGIWNRFQYTYMFFYTTIPLILLLYVRGLERGRLRYAFYMGIASLLSAYAYGSAPLIGTFWLVLASFTVFYLLTNIRNSKNILYGIKFFLLAVVIWLFINSWWLLSFSKTVGYVERVREPMALQADLGILLSISRELGGLINLFRLLHIKFLENMVEVWGPIYFSREFIIIGFLIPIVTFASLLFKPHYKTMFYFAFLSILGLFLVKGDYVQASEKFRGASSQAVKALVARRGMGLRSHGELHAFIAKLREETGDPEIRRLWQSAIVLHQNFYENWLPPKIVEEDAEDVKN